MALVRPERPSDVSMIHAVHAASFPTDEEARLVSLLRQARRLTVSLLAEADGSVVGHAAFSPVSTATGALGAGLAPVAVLESHRRQGIAAQLIRAGLAECRSAGFGWAVVLGEPAYYSRFGFRPASAFGLTSEYGSGPAFQVVELISGGIPSGAGLVRYAPEFASLGTGPGVASAESIPMIDFDAFDVLTFDCYGTLIDWESGILAALAPVFDAHRVSPEPDQTLELSGELETVVESGEYVAYRVVLMRVLEGLGAHLGFSPSARELEAFSTSVRDWPAFPDSPGALHVLKSRYKLAVISNIDDELFAHSARRLVVPFDWVVTAQQVRSYKPSLENFRRAFERIGVPPARILHVAQSLFHDIGPARRLGLSTVWVNRRHGKQGFGATTPAHAEPDLEVPDLQTLAQRAGLT